MLLFAAVALDEVSHNQLHTFVYFKIIFQQNHIRITPNIIFRINKTTYIRWELFAELIFLDGEIMKPLEFPQNYCVFLFNIVEFTHKEWTDID